MQMKSRYPGPGMFAFPYTPGPYQVYEGPGSTHPFLLGYLPQPDGINQPFYRMLPSPPVYDQQQYKPEASNFDGSDGSAIANGMLQDYIPQLNEWNPNLGLSLMERNRLPRLAKPGKGFFSSGRGETASWRSSKALASPEKENAVTAGARDEKVRRTIYITDVDQQVTEEQLAMFFQACGDVKDCRVCGDPNSAMRFAFIEFASEDAADRALESNGTVLGDFPLRVLPSKTAIVPVNNQYLPRNVIEREKVVRTVYAANIDKKVDRDSVKLFFETLCGHVAKIRLLGDWQHATRIAFVEFATAESAKLALSCSGALLGSLPVRVSPSKTPVRDEPIAAPEKVSK